MDLLDLAGSLFGSRRAEGGGVPSSVVDGITATGAAASADGEAAIVFDADVTPADEDGDVDETAVSIPTSPSIEEGDEVIVALVGDGPLKTPMVMANPGSGDRTAKAAQSALDAAESVQGIAQDALDVANATGQHFWDDDSGAHVTEATREEWEAEQSGPNSLWNSLGMLFRNGLNNLMAVLTSGIAIYDGEGNDADDIVAEFSADRIKIGQDYADDGLTQATVGFFDGDTMLDAQHYVQGSATYHDLYLKAVQEGTQSQDVAGSLGVHLQAASEGGSYADVAEASLDANAAPQGMSAGKVAISSYYSGGTLSRTLSVLADQVFLSSFQSQAVQGSNLSASMADVIAMLSTATQTLTKTSAVSSWSAGQAMRSGKVVTVTLVGVRLASALASGANSAVLTNVPAGFRPNALQRVPVALNVTGNYANCWAAVGAGGNIQLHNGSGLSIAASAELSMNCTYIIS